GAAVRETRQRPRLRRLAGLSAHARPHRSELSDLTLAKPFNTIVHARCVLVAALTVLAVVGLSQSARSQIWPQKPVKILVPFAPGGNSDGIARLIAQPLGDAFGQQFAVENRPAAVGALAAEAVARSSAGGHMLLMVLLQCNYNANLSRGFTTCGIISMTPEE